MFKWLRRKKPVATPTLSPGLQIKEVEINHEADSEVGPDVAPEVAAQEREFQRKRENSKLWIARVELALNLHLHLEFPKIAPPGGQLSTLKAVKLIESINSFPPGNWPMQKLVIHFKDMDPVIEGYRPIVSQLVMGIAPDEEGSAAVNAFSAALRPFQRWTPRLPREHHYQMVQDLMTLGSNLNEQLADKRFRVTHIDLERSSGSQNDTFAGYLHYLIEANQELKYIVKIPPAPAALI